MEKPANPYSQQDDIIYPIKFIASNSDINFFHAINESIIVYIAGKNLLLENIRNHQQLVISTNQGDTQIETIFRVINSYGQVQIGLIVKNSRQSRHTLKIFEIDWNSFLHKRNSQKQINLLNIEFEDTIVKAQLDRKIQTLALVEANKQNYFLVFYCLKENKQISSLSITQAPIAIKYFEFNTTNYFALIFKNQITFYSTTSKYFQQIKMIPNEQLSLIGRQGILQVQFEQSQRNQILIFILTSKGQFKIGSLKGHQFDDFIQIDFCLTSQVDSVAITYYPSAFTCSGNKVIYGYYNCRRISYITYSLLNYSQFTTTTSQNVLFYKEQEIQSEAQQKFERSVNVDNISSSSDNCIYAISVLNQNNSNSLMIVDTLQSLAQPENIDNPSHKIFGNFTFTGKCYSVSHVQFESAFFVLYEDNSNKCKLTRYSIEYASLRNINPHKVIDWDETLKMKTLEIEAHPLNRIIVLIHQETVKIHFYSKEYLFESHATLNVPSCQCARFNSYGNKLYLGTLFGILIVDSNLYEVTNIISSNAYMGKIPKRFAKYSMLTMALEVASGNNSFLYEISETGEVSLLGNLQMNKKEMQIQAQNNSKRTVLAIDKQKKIGIWIDHTKKIVFWTLTMEKINYLEIEAECIEFCGQINILLIGGSNGALYICNWPEIVSYTKTVDYSDNSIVGISKIHSNPIASLKFSVNYRYIYSITVNGEICISEFFHENSSLISRQASLQILKKSNCKAVSNLTITSQELETKRIQSIIKMGGKHAKTSAKNQAIHKELSQKLDNNFLYDEAKIKRELREQLQTCEEEQRVREIMRKIHTIKGMINDMNFRSNRQIPEIHSIYEREIQKVFEQKNQLEQTIHTVQDQLKGVVGLKKYQTINQLSQHQQLFTTQIKLIQKGLHSHSIINSKYQLINKGLLINLEEDKEETQTILSKELDQQLMGLIQKKKQTTANMRKLTFMITQLRQKQRVFGLRTLQMGTNLEILKSQNPDCMPFKTTLARRLQQATSKSEKLMDEERFEEIKKQQSEIKSLHSEKYFETLQKEYNQLAKEYKQIQKEETQLEDQFFSENQKKIKYNDLLITLNLQIKELKQKRDRIKRQAVTKKNNTSRSLFYRTSAPSIKPNPSKQNSPTHHKLEEREMYCQKIDRMNTIKNEKIRKCIIINEKLIGDNKKLTSQLNELRRYNEYLVKKQKKLKLQISRGTLSLKGGQQRGKRPKISFHGQNKGKMIKNQTLKRGFFSLYNSTCDKLTQ